MPSPSPTPSTNPAPSRVPRRITFSMELPPLPPDSDAPATDLSLDMLRGIPIHPDHRGAIRFHADQIGHGNELVLLVKALNTLLELLPAAPPSHQPRRVPAAPAEAGAPRARSAAKPPRSRRKGN